MILRSVSTCQKCGIVVAGVADRCVYCGGECKSTHRPSEWFAREESIDMSTANPVGGY